MQGESQGRKFHTDVRQGLYLSILHTLSLSRACPPFPLIFNSLSELKMCAEKSQKWADRVPPRLQKGKKKKSNELS